MAVTVWIPAPLRPLTENKQYVAADAASLHALIDEMERRYPGFAQWVCEPDGQIRRYINVYVNDEDARLLQGLDTPLKDGDEVSIVPAIAGG
ncbi:MAG: MoaD/ThiS family protein [Armatimonadota bacterium]